MTTPRQLPFGLSIFAGIGPRSACSLALAASLAGATANSSADEPSPARVRIVTVDARTGAELPCRIHLKNPSGQPVRVPPLPFFFDHVSTPGTAEARLGRGTYAYEVERGPEFSARSGTIDVAQKDVEVKVALERIADMAAEGWVSGDLHIHRRPGEIEAIVRSEDLHIAPLMTWWNKQNWWSTHPLPDHNLIRFDSDRYCDIMAGEDEREGGALLFFFQPRPLAIAGAKRESPSELEFAATARSAASDCWIDAEKPFWWDFPVWVALGAVDSVGIANNHMTRGGNHRGDEAWGRPRDKSRLPSALGNGYYSQEIYYALLESGLRLPPSAGSASGVLPNPVGYNRVYAYVGEDRSYPAWWNAVRAGHSFVTNGPLLRVEADGFKPGHVFRAESGARLSLSLTARLSGRDKVSAIEIIRNGRVERAVDVAGKGDGQSISLGSLGFSASGWFLVRAVADNDRTFRFASTAPFHVEIGDATPRISRQACRYFLDWVRERIARINLPEGPERAAVLSYHHKAERFWQGRMERANAD